MTFKDSMRQPVEEGYDLLSEGGVMKSRLWQVVFLAWDPKYWSY